MKLKKWTSKVKEKHKEGQIYLRLITDKDRDVTLIACDENGEMINRGDIAYFNEDDKVLVMNAFLNEKFGFKRKADDSLLTISQGELVAISHCLEIP